MRLIIILSFAFFTFLIAFFIQKKSNFTPINNTITKITPASPSPSPRQLVPPSLGEVGSPLQTQASPLPTLPSSYLIPQKLHVFQTFNNCGPASLSMLLSYFGINKSQEEVGERLRPYQNPQGDNDDKSVTLEELASVGKEYNLTAFHRPNGNIKLLKQFIENNIPVITRTLLSENEDIGHYRVVRGYDDENETLIQDDSLQGKNLSYSYQKFDSLWKNFNYEYLVLVPKDKKLLAERILGEDIDEKKAWSKAVANAKKALEKDPSDLYVRFNLSVALFYTGEYNQSISEYEKVAGELPFRTLWYQIEPIQAYDALGMYEKVFSITDKILNNGNRAFSELYLIRGKIYQKQGKPDLAQEEFQKAVFYNKYIKVT